MTWRAYDHSDGPEPLPPEELLRSRRILVEPARPEIRGHHVATAAAEVRRARAMSSAQALARRSARIVAGVAATIVVTSSLAGAQILVEPARAIFPTVSDHLIPHRSPDQTPGDYVPADTSPSETDPPTDVTTTRPGRRAGAGKAAVSADSVETTVAEKPVKSTATATATSSTTSSTSSTSTTEPGSSTTTTEPDSSTSTTEPGSSTTTTEPDSSTTTTEPDSSTTTTLASPSVSTKAPPA